MPTVARYIISSEIPVALALRVGDAMRAALMSVDGGGGAKRCSQFFSGKDEAGGMLRNQGHKHAYYLATDESGDHTLDHVVVYARGELSERCRESLTALDWIVVGGAHVPVEMIGMDSPEDVDVPLFASCREWRSVTPFLLTRHPKLYGKTGRAVRTRRPRLKESNLCVEASGTARLEQYGVFGTELQRDSAVDQLCRELDRMHGVDRGDIELVTPSDDCCGVSPWAFQRVRQNPPATDRPFAFRFRLKMEITGPVALGYACHQGLGLFVPVE